jgi:uncharacterized protein YggE
MKRAFALSMVFAALVASAQDIQVNRQNKTISITADESATADAEVATLAIGYHNFAPTQEAAYRDNLVVAEQITKALLGAKVSKENIETDKLRLGRTEAEEKWTEEMKKERRFEAQQSWHVTASSSDAQGLVDLVVKAGANEVEDVEWNVADPLALQAKASGAALAKARAIAEQMAKGLGTKLGELVYASNRAPVAKMWRGSALNTVMVNAEATEKKPKLRLFPQKVKSDATVYAVFAIE